MKSKLLLIIILVLTLSACNESKEKTVAVEETPVVELKEKMYSYFDSGDGVISVPENYREWEFVGSWSIAGEEEGAAGMHSVYASPGTVAYYQENKSFPNGAVLVKELVDTHTETLTTGVASRANNIQGWFVMVKDANNQYPDNPLWGDGWGWSFFGADNKTTTTSTDYKVDCIGCHVPAQQNDWIYVEGYPVLTSN